MDKSEPREEEWGAELPVLGEKATRRPTPCDVVNGRFQGKHNGFTVHFPAKVVAHGPTPRTSPGASL